MIQQITHQLKVAKDTAYDLGQNVVNFSFAAPELTHVVIMTRPRSGSTCLLDLLSMHSQVISDRHMFYHYASLPKRFDENTVHSKKNVRAYKFKIQPSGYELSDENYTLARAGIQQLCRDNVKLIYLERENLVRQAVSWMLADRVKKQNYRKGQKPVKIASMAFDPNLLLERIQRFEAIADFEKRVLSDIPHLYLSYEQHLISEADHAQTMGEVFKFSQIEAEETVTRYVRLSSNDLSESIDNYPEIEAFLKGTKYFDQLSG